DNRLIREGFEQFNLHWSEETHLGATCDQYPNKFPLMTKGSGQEGVPSDAGPHHWKIVLRADVGKVERAVLTHPVKLWPINTELEVGDTYGTKMSPRNHHVVLAESQRHVINPTNPRGALDDGVENRLYV